MNGFKNEKFSKVVHLKHGGTGDGSSYGSPLPLVDADLLAIEAGMVIEKVYAIVDVAVTGTTALEVGDDDDANGFVVDLAAGLATPGMYGWDAKAAGAYLRVQTAGGTDAADIDVVPAAKYYSAAGKEVKLNVTTASTAGSVRIVIEGMKLKQ